MSMMKLQVFDYGNLENDDDSKNYYDCHYNYGDWNEFNSSCIGLICDNGIFEYRDIYTNQFIKYQIVISQQNNELYKENWLHFIFISPTEIIFIFENDKNIYKTSFILNQSDWKIFPNNLSNKEIQTMAYSPFDIELRFECPQIITCFDVDLNFKKIFCGLDNGDILIGNTSSNNNTKYHQKQLKKNQEDIEEEEQIILIQNTHLSQITAITSRMVNAFITAGDDRVVKIWDIDDDKNGELMGISLLQTFENISTNGITNVYPFRCQLTDNELLAITTVEGTIFIYLLDDDDDDDENSQDGRNNDKLMSILSTNFQSEILDVSTMNDGIILSVSTLNGYVYLYDMVNFKQVSYQKLSEKPMIFAKYKKSSTMQENHGEYDYYFIDYEGICKLYPTTPVTSRQSQSETQHDIDTINTFSNLPSMTTTTNNIPSPVTTTTNFTVNTIPQRRTNNPHSKRTISSSLVQGDGNNMDYNENLSRNLIQKTTIQKHNKSKSMPFKTINSRKRNIINPLKNESILKQMNNPNKNNVDPKSYKFSQGQTSSISNYYKNKIQEIENEQFDINKAKLKADKKKIHEFEKIAMQKMMLEEERRQKIEKPNVYDTLPSIPTKEQVITQKYSKKKDKRKKKTSEMIEDKNRFSIAPSIKPFMKRSLEPERRFNKNNCIMDRNRRERERKEMNMRRMNGRRKTLSVFDNMSTWMKTSYNQRL